MKPNLNIKLKTSGGYRANRYLYGGTGGIAQFTYDSHILYDDPNINYEGAFSTIVRHLYGAHICYGGPGGTFFETANVPEAQIVKTIVNTRDQVVVKPIGGMI